MLTAAACGKKETGASGSNSGGKDTAGKPDSSTVDPADTGKFDGLVVVDNDQFFMQITGVGEDENGVCLLHCSMENRSEDMKWSFKAIDASVNSLACDPTLFETLYPGKAGEADITFSGKLGFEQMVGAPTDIVVTIEIADGDDHNAAPAFEKEVHIYPDGKQNAVRYAREAGAKDVVLMDNEDFTITMIDYREDAEWSGNVAVDLYIVNKTDKLLRIDGSDVFVNGERGGYVWFLDLPAGSSGYENIHLYDDVELDDVKEITTRVVAQFKAEENQFFDETMTIRP